jgi:hypothetical protein
LTAEELADMIWESQVEYSPGMKEAERQQRRALTKYTTDILVILSGLGYVELSPRPTRCGSSFLVASYDQMRAMLLKPIVPQLIGMNI